MRGLGDYIGELKEGWRCAGILGPVLVCLWATAPVSLSTVIHPTDACGFMAWIQGLAIPRYVTQRMASAGFGVALAVLVGLSLLQLGVVTLIYRRAQFYVSTAPAAITLVGVIGNGAWWMQTGHFDLEGALIGTWPFVWMIGCQMICEKLGADFVFGKGNRPHLEPAW